VIKVGKGLSVTLLLLSVYIWTGLYHEKLSWILISSSYYISNAVKVAQNRLLRRLFAMRGAMQYLCWWRWWGC